MVWMNVHIQVHPHVYTCGSYHKCNIDICRHAHAYSKITIQYAVKQYLAQYTEGWFTNTYQSYQLLVLISSSILPSVQKCFSAVLRFPYIHTSKHTYLLRSISTHCTSNVYRIIHVFLMDIWESLNIDILIWKTNVCTYTYNLSL